MQSDKSESATEYPGWWPRGLDEDNLCEKHCDHCDELRRRLEDYRSGIAPTGDTTLDSFAES